jgi:hypothetical protein
MRMLAALMIMAVIAFIGCSDSATTPDDSARQHPTGFASSTADYVLYGVSSGGDALSAIDLVTGVSTLIGPLDPTPGVYATPIAMAVRACDGEIFVWNNSSAGDEPNDFFANGRLLTVESCTGQATPVDSLLAPQGQMSAMAFHPDGRLFGLDAALYAIDPATGVATSIGATGTRIGGADFHPVTGVLYAAELGGARRLGTIDITTGAFTEIDTLHLDQDIMGTIAFDPSDNTLYGASMFENGRLFQIDPATAAVSNFVLVTGITPQGMGWAPACGEEGGDCNELEAPEITLVIKPGGCPNPLNPRSQGVTPMALLGSDGMSVEDIDVSSLEINGVSPLRSSYEDVGGPVGEPAEDCECAEGDYDDIMDLTLKFSTQALIATLGEVSRGDVVELTLTGMLGDGTSFETSECMVIVGR